MGDCDWQEVTRRKRRSVFDRLGSSSNGRAMLREFGDNMLSVYVLNFPSHLSVRELWNICGKKGNTVDVYIAKHKNKFDRKEGPIPIQTNVKRHASYVLSPVVRGTANSQSYINVVRGQSNGVKKDTDSVQLGESSLVLLSQEVNDGFSLTLIGCHKDFRSTANSKVICRNEGFLGVDTKYLGGLWVLFKFNDKDARDRFLKHEGILSWFSSLKPWHDDFVVKERLVWLEGEVILIDDTDNSNRFSIRLCIKSSHASLIFASKVVTLKGVSYAFRVRELCRWTPNFVLDDVDNKEKGSVRRHRNNEGNNLDEHENESVCDILVKENDEELQFREEGKKEVENNAEKVNDSDPLESASLIAKQSDYNKNKKGSSTPKYPPGFTQNDVGDTIHDFSDVLKESEAPKKYTGISMVQQVEDTIKVGNALGFNMEGCEDMLAKMIADMGEKIETKMVRVDLWSLTQVWGNTRFDFASTSAREKGLSDHRPILLKESMANYGPTPFWFFHSWLEIEGFMIWLLTLRKSMPVVKGDIERKEVSDLAQKSKIKWAIEGDKILSFFHGSLKKKWRQIAIQGVLKNGACIEDPGEWIWRFRCSPNDLWVKLIKEIHGIDGGIGCGRLFKPSKSHWNAILRSVQHLQLKGIDLLSACCRSVGDGKCTRFWDETWCGDRPLKDLFPRVYALEGNKNVCWALDSSGFSVASARKFIDEQTLIGDFTSTRWPRCVPIKVNIFMWRLSLNKILTLVNLDRKGIDVASLLCPVCSEHIESVDHLFFSCGMTRDIWVLLARWCHLDFLKFSNIVEWFLWLNDCQVSKTARLILEGVVAAMLWSIWNIRNALIFSDSKPKKANIWDSIVNQSFTLISSRNPKFRLCWISWLGNLIDDTSLL
nr:hypothetical protein [Tanacetum cinerariifolium]